MDECFALTFLPPPEPDIFGGERGGEEEEKAEREISKPLPLSFSLSLSLSVRRVCAARTNMIFMKTGGGFFCLFYVQC